MCIYKYIFFFIHSFISIQPQRPGWQEPEPSHVTGMALAYCILGKFFGVVCHCFPPPLDIPIFAARCIYIYVCVCERERERESVVHLLLCIIKLSMSVQNQQRRRMCLSVNEPPPPKKNIFSHVYFKVLCIVVVHMYVALCP